MSRRLNHVLLIFVMKDSYYQIEGPHEFYSHCRNSSLLHSIDGVMTRSDDY
jgi:hypothetical protein